MFYHFAEDDHLRSGDAPVSLPKSNPRSVVTPGAGSTAVIVGRLINMETLFLCIMW